ncbi:MAG TPA: response regulator [Kofleriaceae bacterium]|nr:response regulator [Kofleriaceae bacterium]
MVVDDDEHVLAAFRRSFVDDRTVLTANDAVVARHLAKRERPDLAVVDLRLGNNGSGLDLIRDLRADQPNIKLVLMSGWLSLATAMAAVHAGADMFLPKPTTLVEIIHHIESGTTPIPDIDTTPSLARVEFEHISRVMADSNGNITEAARRLGLHRQSLQRKLRKKVPQS